MEKQRVEFLQQALQQDADNTFVRYALALELAGSERPEDAWPHFSYLLDRHPEYVPTYYHAGKWLAARGQIEEARRVLNRGIQVSSHQGNVHARSELEAALEDLAVP
jgi:tetratricopeptide (TPR) repeat protein